MVCLWGGWIVEGFVLLGSMVSTLDSGLVSTVVASFCTCKLAGFVSSIWNCSAFSVVFILHICFQGQLRYFF